MTSGDDDAASAAIRQCAFCKQTGSPNVPLLLCSACSSVRYCSRHHQQQDWKQHKTQCKQLRTGAPPASVSASPSAQSASAQEEEEKKQPQPDAPAVVAASSPQATERKTMAEMKAEKEAAIAARTAAAVSSSSSSPSPLPSSPAAADSTAEAVTLTPWMELLWSRIRELLERADAELDSGNAAAAVVSLTQAVQLHAALPTDCPRSVLHSLYGYRSVAYLSLPVPLPHLAVFDALTSLKVKRDYTHAWGLIFNAWKAFGNLKKAREAAEMGSQQAAANGEAALVQRFDGMLKKLQEETQPTAAVAAAGAQEAKGKKGRRKARQQAGSSSAEVATEAIVVEAKNLRGARQAQATDADMSSFQTAVQSGLSASLYHIPHISTLASLPLFYPPRLSSAALASDAEYYASITQGRGFSVAFSPTLGRHLVATRAFKAGDIIIAERPLYSATYGDDLCSCCWRRLPLEDGKVVNAVQCQRGCGYELYCSAQCRDERWLLHEPICGHDWRELKERAAETVTSSGLIWLLLPLIMADLMQCVRKREKQIRQDAIRCSLSKKATADASSSSSSLLSAPAADVLSSLPFSRLQSHHELPAAFLASTQHDFDRLWAMWTLLTFWFVIRPATSAAAASPQAEPSLSSAASLSFLPYLTFAFFESAYSRLLLNSFCLQMSPAAGSGSSSSSSRSHPRTVFVAVGALSSLLSHDCFPNCRLVSDGQKAEGRLLFMCSKAVKKGDALTVSYIGEGSEAGDRLQRAEALLPYGFACSCRKCRREKADEEELLRLYRSHGLTLPAASEA